MIISIFNLLYLNYILLFKIYSDADLTVGRQARSSSGKKLTSSEKKQPETVAKVVEGVGSEKNQPERVREVVEGDVEFDERVETFLCGANDTLVSLLPLLRTIHSESSCLFLIF